VREGTPRASSPPIAILVAVLWRQFDNIVHASEF
jgi:hypothetical protein